MNPQEIRGFYEQEDVVQHYAAAVDMVGLWKSEELIFTRLFERKQRILELGCGAGRITFGLHRLGYWNLVAMDYSAEMIAVARQLAVSREVEIAFEMGDACALDYEDGAFEGAVFGFNGLMQIPGGARREQAMREIARVIRKGANFVFTSHDRANPRYRKHWQEESRRWEDECQNPRYEEFGDRIGETPRGEMFIHVPERQEIHESLRRSGFHVVSCRERRELAEEDAMVRDFSDECLFWVCRKL